MKKIGIIAAALALLFSTVPAYAAKPATTPAATPKATGGVGYTAYGLQRRAEFNAFVGSTTCSYMWTVTGNHVFTFMLDGDLVSTYPHDAFLTQAGTAVTGNGGYPVGGPYAYSWHITSGSLVGSALNLSILYDTGAPGTVMTMLGTMALDGSFTGTWTDDFGGIRTGTWTAPANTAMTVYDSGCTGKGKFKYSDVNGNWYTVDVQYVSVSGDYAWFAGPVVSGNVGAGNWLFAKVHDGGEPSNLVDEIWGSFTTEAAAKNGVALMLNPGDGPFAITSGNLQVH